MSSRSRPPGSVRRRAGGAAAAVLALCLASPGSAAGEAFLDDGGSITTVVRQLGVQRHRERGFLEDGGSVTVVGPAHARPRYRHDDRRFLQDGGSITVYDSIPIVVPDPDRFRHHRSKRHGKGQGEERFSDIVIWDHEPGGSGFGGLGEAVVMPRDAGPKLIDVGASRLDRTPLGAGDIEVTYSGGAKIIRLGPGYRRQEGVARAKTAALGVSPLSGPPQLEPWSQEWEAWCREAYDSFDGDRGTYVTFDGRRRFCIAE